MCSTDKTETNATPRPQWGPILQDMCILVCIMAFLGWVCKMAMVPFEHTSPTDSLVSIIMKGAVTDGKDETFIKEMKKGREQSENFVNSADNTGRTPLMWAAYCNFNDVKQALDKDSERLYYVRELLNTPGIDIAAVDRDGFTALHWAAWSGMPETAQLLLDAGLNINTADARGFTPLMLAAMRGNSSLVKKLLDAGADASLRNADGRTAQELAVENESAYNKRQAKVFELIYAPSREAAYRETLEVFAAAAPQQH